jgi:SNF2 family DNA or RNA helicase
MFDFWVTSPIKSKRPDSLRRLKDVVRATCLRRTKAMTGKSLQLPLRAERIESIELHQADQELYNFFRLRTSKIAAGLSLHEDSTSGQRRQGNILSLINFLRLICNHGEHLLPPSALNAWRDRDSASIDWEMMRGCRRRCDACGADVEETDNIASTCLEFRCRHLICAVCAIHSNDDSTSDERMCPKCAIAPTGGAGLRASDLSITSARPSAKVEALLRNLHEEQTTGNWDNPTKRYEIQMYAKSWQFISLMSKASYSVTGPKCSI